MTHPDNMLRISEHILEIRYKPNPKILDHRGTWAELISAELGLAHWRIIENRIDIHDKDRKELAFVGFRNSGFTCFDAPTANYFPDKAVKFLKFVLNLEDFGSPVLVERLGVRSKFVFSHPQGFEDLRERFSSRFFSLTDAAKSAISAKLVDIGLSLNFADKLGNFNTICGPMQEEQIRQYIDRAGDYPKIGLFFDIDYWVRPNKEMDSAEILRLIRGYATEGWNRSDRIRDVVCGD